MIVYGPPALATGGRLGGVAPETTAIVRENSEVLFAMSVAVAVINCPTATATGKLNEKDALPEPSVRTACVPSNL